MPALDAPPCAPPNLTNTTSRTPPHKHHLINATSQTPHACCATRRAAAQLRAMLEMPQGSNDLRIILKELGMSVGHRERLLIALAAH
eukprot:450723-Prymnesium_polylepis.2